jgi:hypothetical protein
MISLMASLTFGREIVRNAQKQKLLGLQICIFSRHFEFAPNQIVKLLSTGAIDDQKQQQAPPPPVTPRLNFQSNLRSALARDVDEVEESIMGLMNHLNQEDLHTKESEELLNDNAAVSINEHNNVDPHSLHESWFDNRERVRKELEAAIIDKSVEGYIHRIETRKRLAHTENVLPPFTLWKREFMNHPFTSVFMRGIEELDNQDIERILIYLHRRPRYVDYVTVDPRHIPKKLTHKKYRVNTRLALVRETQRRLTMDGEYDYINHLRVKKGGGATIYASKHDDVGTVLPRAMRHQCIALVNLDAWGDYLKSTDVFHGQHVPIAKMASHWSPLMFSQPINAASSSNKSSSSSSVATEQDDAIEELDSTTAPEQKVTTPPSPQQQQQQQQQQQNTSSKFKYGKSIQPDYKPSYLPEIYKLLQGYGLQQYHVQQMVIKHPRLVTIDPTLLVDQVEFLENELLLNTQHAQRPGLNTPAAATGSSGGPEHVNIIGSGSGSGSGGGMVGEHGTTSSSSCGDDPVQYNVFEDTALDGAQQVGFLQNDDVSNQDSLWAILGHDDQLSGGGGDGGGDEYHIGGNNSSGYDKETRGFIDNILNNIGGGGGGGGGATTSSTTSMKPIAKVILKQPRILTESRDVVMGNIQELMSENRIGLNEPSFLALIQKNPHVLCGAMDARVCFATWQNKLAELLKMYSTRGVKHHSSKNVPEVETKRSRWGLKKRGLLLAQLLLRESPALLNLNEDRLRSLPYNMQQLEDLAGRKATWKEQFDDIVGKACRNFHLKDRSHKSLLDLKELIWAASRPSRMHQLKYVRFINREAFDNITENMSFMDLLFSTDSFRFEMDFLEYTEDAFDGRQWIPGKTDYNDDEDDEDEVMAG